MASRGEEDDSNAGSERCLIPHPHRVEPRSWRRGRPSSGIMTTIYYSFTYEDLKDYRRVVFDILRKSGYQVIAMEDYVTTDRQLLRRRWRNTAGLSHFPYNMKRAHFP
jgi:hypothetical protein